MKLFTSTRSFQVLLDLQCCVCMSNGLLGLTWEKLETWEELWMCFDFLRCLLLLSRPYIGPRRLIFSWSGWPSLPTLFILFLCLFLSLWSFHLYFIPWIRPTTLRFLTLFPRSYFCLIGPFNYISLCESLRRTCYNPFMADWAQSTGLLTN